MSDELDTIVAADNDKYMIRCENLVKIYKLLMLRWWRSKDLTWMSSVENLWRSSETQEVVNRRCSICLEDLISLRRETFMWTVRTFEVY